MKITIIENSIKRKKKAKLICFCIIKIFFKKSGYFYFFSFKLIFFIFLDCFDKMILKIKKYII
jgi:hypothetical protein